MAKKATRKKSTTRRKPAQAKKRSPNKITEKRPRSVTKKASKKAGSKRKRADHPNLNAGRPGPGRPKGSKNKATKEARALARDIVQDQTYLNKLAQRVKAGKAQKLEVLLWHYAYGVPKQPFQIEGADGSDPFAMVLEALWRARNAESSTTADNS